MLHVSVGIGHPLSRGLIAVLLAALALAAGPHIASAGGTVGNGTPSDCTDASFNAALVGGGTVTFNCGPDPLTIVIAAKTIAANTTIDGGGKLTLSGNDANRLFVVNGGVTLTL